MQNEFEGIVALYSIKMVFKMNTRAEFKEIMCAILDCVSTELKV